MPSRKGIVHCNYHIPGYIPTSHKQSFKSWLQLVKWMGWWRKASSQNNDEEDISYHHTQKIDFLSKFVFVYSQKVVVCFCSYLAKSRTKYNTYKKNYASTSCKEEVGVFVRISCLTQMKQKHLLWLQTTIYILISDTSTVQV